MPGLKALLQSIKPSRAAAVHSDSMDAPSTCLEDRSPSSTISHDRKPLLVE